MLLLAALIRDRRNIAKFNGFLVRKLESRGLLEDNYRILADRPVTYQAGHFFVRHTIAFIEVTGLGKVRVDPYYIGECEGGDYK